MKIIETRLSGCVVVEPAVFGDERGFFYEGWNAQRFGLAPEQIDGMAAPVLVRVRTTPVNRAEFARQANAATVA